MTPIGYTAKTQKARGLYEIDARERSTSFAPFGVPNFVVYEDEPTVLPAFPGPWFARPAPLQACHGFVDSRRVESIPEMQVVWKEAKAADEHAELIVMPEVKADVSALWAGGTLTMGPDNDGATSGHGCVVLPTSDTPPIAPPYQTVNEAPYFEFVLRSGRPIQLVQMRNGLALESKALDFIPFDPAKPKAYFKVEHVVQATGDLLEWQAICKTFKPGTCVHHPEGSTTTHYSVHCRANKIPILITRAPVVGEKLKPNHAEKLLAIEAMLEGARIGLGIQTITPRQALIVMLSMLHNYAALDLSVPAQAKFMGAGAALGVRLGFLASLAEAGYAHIVTSNHDKVWEEYWPNFPKLLAMMPKTQEAFLKHKWSSGYGGPKWAQCLTMTTDVWDGLALLAKPLKTPPTKEHIATLTGAERLSAIAHKAHATQQRRELTAKAPTAIINALNLVVNTSHNTGLFLNKFVYDTTWFDLAATCPARTAILSVESLWKIHRASAASDGYQGPFDKLKVTKKYLDPKGAATSKHAAIAMAVAKAQAALLTKPTKVLEAQACIRPGNILHIQYHADTHKTADGWAGYATHDLPMSGAVQAAMKAATQFGASWAGSSKSYVTLTIAENGKDAYLGDILILQLI